MKKVKLRYYLCVLLLMFLIIPMAVWGEASSGGSAGSGSGASGSGSSSGKIPGNAVAGIRLTVVDRNGNKVSGTNTVDFVNGDRVAYINSNSVYKNTSNDRHKGGVIDGNLSWGTSANMKVVASKATISFSTANHVKMNNRTMINYLGSLAKTNDLYDNWIKETGYDRANNYNQHYIIVEPTLEVIAKGKTYYGTATELAKLIQSSNCPGPSSKKGTCRYNLSLVAKKYLGPSACYDGEFSRAGEKNNGVTLDSENTLIGYISSNEYTSGPRFEYSCANTYDSDSNLYNRISGKYNGNGVIVFYMAAMLKEQCDINNPLHFHSASDDYQSVTNDDGTGTQTCCEQMIEKYGLEYVTKLYPICGACEVKTKVSSFECGKDPSFSATDVSNKEDINAKFSCLFQGVEGPESSKYDINARKGVRERYRVGTLGNEYCEVYCIEDVTGLLPDNYKNVVNPGGTFVWPDYKNYQANVETTRSCKVRFRQQEWLNDFNNSNTTGKETLLTKLKQCANSTGEEKYYDNYGLVEAVRECQKDYNSAKCQSALKSTPKLTIEYNNGVETRPQYQLKLNADQSSVETYNCTNCNIDTSSWNIYNVASAIESIANQISNKLFTFTVNLNYVLPDGLYQYIDKKTGVYIEYYNREESSDYDEKNKTIIDGKLDTGYSKLLVNEKAKIGKKYDVTIRYSNLSPVNSKFNTDNKKYTCKYEVNNDTTNPKCDYNEPNHFKDLNGDGILDSGPNGEDCCEMIELEHGKNSEIYQDLVDKGWCPVDPGDNNPGGSCEYPADINTTDLVTKKKCCEMLKYDYSIEEDTRQDYLKRYCSEEPYCPQDCEDGVCHYSPMTQDLRNCIASGKSYNECKIDNCPGGGAVVIYRPISLLSDEAFPGVEKLDRIWSNNNWYYYSNWAYRGGDSQDRDYYTNKYITNNRMVKEYELYNIEPMYVINLDADAIGKIRNYNKTNSYDDFILECKNDRQCRSKWIKQYVTPDSCGINDDWYDCDGVDASWGD